MSSWLGFDLIDVGIYTTIIVRLVYRPRNLASKIRELTLPLKVRFLAVRSEIISATPLKQSFTEWALTSVDFDSGLCSYSGSPSAPDT